MARKAKNSQLKRHTHKGRRARTGSNAGGNVVGNGGRGIRATKLRADPRLTSAALSQISPTPHGPEPHWPGGS
jgi:hypothetical protein